ncbi:dephospho-CoA kinase [Acidipila rosea]|uniref:Dephospho-CoA kinase n=1 Tax=Acidipila rosea TaxID=768535 RepID=A0A4V2PV19_9BACT|nr:dephospho-CoA kinase [Acidipila rosea]MBW4026361.1 dephospho-CoA kinase [Acidobacteriota bacterium]MBW4044503.1 dephospho-CoA kinase [Acidobacteriota bacterium]TCK72681.1 dephospho-CoA kinase [Acidipila rosea]
MLRVGLTGGLGSGKTTVAGMLAELGAHTLSADEVGRRLMEPGEPVYAEIVRHFGPAVVGSDGRLDRSKLSGLAFKEGRLAELNRIVHPAVIAAQEAWARELAVQEPQAIAVVESALIFEADSGGTAPGWRSRFDRIVLVTAPEALKIARFVERMAGRGLKREALEADARARLAAQLPDSEKMKLSDYVIDNSGSLEETREQTERIFRALREQN